jgi:hypothetical protein
MVYDPTLNELEHTPLLMGISVSTQHSVRYDPTSDMMGYLIYLPKYIDDLRELENYFPKIKILDHRIEDKRPSGIEIIITLFFSPTENIELESRCVNTN